MAGPDEDARTRRAAALAFAIGLVSIGGLGLFSGFAALPSIVVGAVFGALFALLILAAARRADSFTDAPGVDTRPRDDEGSAP